MYNGIARILEEAGKDDSVTVTVFTGKLIAFSPFKSVLQVTHFRTSGRREIYFHSIP